MKSKLRLYINLAVICLCIFAMVVGVYSATTATLTVSGSIGFKAHNCELSVSGTKTGYASEDLLTYETDNVAIDMDTTTEGVQDTGKVSGKGGDDTISTVNLGTLNFTDLAEDTIPPIVITLTFTNLSPFQVSAFVTVDETKLTNIAYTRQYAMGTDISATKTDHSGAIILEPASNNTPLTKKAVTFTLTFKVATPEQSIDPSSTLTINANFAKYDNTAIPTTYEDTTQGLIYTRSAGTSSGWSVKGNNPTSTISVAPVIHNLPVTTVAEKAFQSNTTITSVTIPNTVTTIGSYAFDRCTNLADISMPNTVKSIGQYAFQKCTSLTSIYVPNSVTSIGGYAFINCKGLTKVNISSLENWFNISFGTSNSNPLDSAKKLYVNDVLLTKLIIPNNLTKLKKYIFNNCQSLTGDLIIPDGITDIGVGAFDGCNGLTGNLVIPDSVTNLGEDAFNSCSGFNGTLTLSNSLTKINKEVFYKCNGFTGTLTIPKDVTSIGESAFSFCSGLTDVTFERETPPTFGTEVFHYCSQLTYIYVPNGDAIVSAYKTATNFTVYESKIYPISNKPLA